jgi:prepilin-type N-terminal cleavage/methylation domain-containing protein
LSHARLAATPTPGAARSACVGARRHGFTYIELLVALGIISILVALFMPVIGKSRASAQSVYCLSQLRQISAGLFQYAADNDRRFPDPFALQTSWEQLLRPYLQGSETFHCPGDSELYPTIGSSYDWRDTGSPDTTLAGRRLADSQRGDCVLAFEALPAWHAKGRMNATLLNGSALSMDQELCMSDLQSPIRVPSPDDAYSPKPAPKWPPPTVTSVP